MLHLIQAHPTFTGDVGKDRRVKVPTPRSHHQSLQRRESHRRVNGPSVLDRRCRTSALQMERYELRFFNRDLVQLRIAKQLVMMRDPMESIPPDMKLVRKLKRQAIHKSRLGDSAM